ncbi:hypothetical protein ACTWP4_19135 [Gracilibacillus sp. D59]|uniref:hypothetical protein n=1 Tax=Gracilibacillus sp. D59 TaxID=3457434 RepID=UPI003FCC5500
MQNSLTSRNNGKFRNMKEKLPSYNDVIELFKKVLKGEVSREKAPEWATLYIVNDEIYDIRDKEL